MFCSQVKSNIVTTLVRLMNIPLGSSISLWTDRSFLVILSTIACGKLVKLCLSVMLSTLDKLFSYAWPGRASNLWSLESYTAKNQKLLKRRIKNIAGQHTTRSSTILFSIVTPDCELIQAEQYYCSTFFTARDNAVLTTLLQPVFYNLQKLIILGCAAQCSPAELRDQLRSMWWNWI